MWELNHKEGWEPKKWCFRTVILEKTLESPLDRKEIKLVNEYSLEGLMLKLKLQYFGHLMQRTDSLEKTLILGKIEGRREGDNRGWDGWMALPIWWTGVWACSGSWWWTGKSGVLPSMGCKETDTTEQLNWTEQNTKSTYKNQLCFYTLTMKYLKEKVKKKKKSHSK